MEVKYCAYKDHEKCEGKIFCQECNIYMCNKCENFHSKLCKNHHIFNLKENNDRFTGLCNIENHLNKLSFYCKTHNQLCCSSCLCVIKNNIYGQHKDCEVYDIENIKNDKFEKLKENMKLLKEISNDLKEKINKLNILYEKINSEKELLKNNIMKIFTEIRNEINRREDEMLSEVDNKFNNIFFNEETIKENKKLPNKIKTSLDKEESINKLWKEEAKSAFFINECLTLEDNIKIINDIYEKMKKCLSLKLNIEFEPSSRNFLLKEIKEFGKINMKEKYNDDINETFNDYLKEKIILGINNIFSFNIGSNLSIDNINLKIIKDSYDNFIKNKKIDNKKKEEEEDDDDDDDIGLGALF